LLGRNDLGTTESFFDLGGHSLKANQMVNKIYQRLGVDINLSDIFTHPTIQELGDMMAERDKALYSYIELT
jgi:acyl carrier protein